MHIHALGLVCIVERAHIKLMNDSVHIYRQYGSLGATHTRVSIGIMKHTHTHTHLAEPPSQSCPDTFEMFDVSSGSSSLGYLHAANNV